ncbi:MAG: PEP/pyruvate-binding domain-containing protein [Steroidobacteraceae bacterium]
MPASRYRPGLSSRRQPSSALCAGAENEAPIRARVAALDPDNLEDAAALSQELRARVNAAPLPADVAAAIARAYNTLNSSRQAAVAVRSSATTEDAADASFAGLQDTYLWVQSLEQTLDKVRSCWGSLYSVESMTYRRRHGARRSGCCDGRGRADHGGCQNRRRHVHAQSADR